MTEYKSLKEYAPFKEGERFEDEDGDILVIGEGDMCRYMDIWDNEVPSVNISHLCTAKVKPLDRAPQPNYNDAKWHGWNGGECPVHPDTIAIVATPMGTAMQAARWANWEVDCDNPIVAFRVIKEHKEPPNPREFWLFTHKCGGVDAFRDEDKCINAASDIGREMTVIKVREVIE